MELFLCALAAFKLTQFVKELIPWPLRPWTKSLISLGAAASFASLATKGFSDWILLAVAAAGLAATLHSLIRFLSSAGDEVRQKVMLRHANPRREFR